MEERKLDKEEIKKRLQELVEEALTLQEDYNDIVRKYGEMNDSYLFQEISFPNEKKKTKKYSK